MGESEVRFVTVAPAAEGDVLADCGDATCPFWTAFEKRRGFEAALENLHNVPNSPDPKFPEHTIAEVSTVANFVADAAWNLALSDAENGKSVWSKLDGATGFSPGHSHRANFKQTLLNLHMEAIKSIYSKARDDVRNAAAALISSLRSLNDHVGTPTGEIHLHPRDDDPDLSDVTMWFPGLIEGLTNCQTGINYVEDLVKESATNPAGANRLSAQCWNQPHSSKSAEDSFWFFQLSLAPIIAQHMREAAKDGREPLEDGAVHHYLALVGGKAQFEVKRSLQEESKNTVDSIKKVRTLVEAGAGSGTKVHNTLGRTRTALWGLKGGIANVWGQLLGAEASAKKAGAVLASAQIADITGLGAILAEYSGQWSALESKSDRVFRKIVEQVDSVPAGKTPPPVSIAAAEEGAEELLKKCTFRRVKVLLDVVTLVLVTKTQAEKNRLDTEGVVLLILGVTALGLELAGFVCTAACLGPLGAAVGLLTIALTLAWKDTPLLEWFESTPWGSDPIGQLPMKKVIPEYYKAVYKAEVKSTESKRDPVLHLHYTRAEQKQFSLQFIRERGLFDDTDHLADLTVAIDLRDGTYEGKTHAPDGRTPFFLPPIKVKGGGFVILLNRFWEVTGGEALQRGEEYTVVFSYFVEGNVVDGKLGDVEIPD